VIPFVIRNDRFWILRLIVKRSFAVIFREKRQRRALLSLALFTFALASVASRDYHLYDAFSIPWAEKKATGHVGFGALGGLYGKHLRFSVKVTGRS